MAGDGGTVTRGGGIGQATTAAIGGGEAAPATTAAREPNELESGDSLGHLTLGERIGEGGMGVVYRAHDARLMRDVAVKMVRYDTAVGRARILREAQAMAQLSHPNVVTVHHVESVGERVYITMELVDGGNLRGWLAAAPRRWREIVARFIDAGRGLAVAHKKGIVHRDFKPDNVLVGGDERVCVADFGLASVDAIELDEGGELDGALSVSVTRTGAILGTPHYMSPEQHGGDRATDRSDQFSFCVALHEAIYGVHPFGGGTLAELAESVSGGALIPRPRRPRVPARLHAAIARGLSVDPDDRHPSMDALVGELEAIAAGGRRRWWFGGGGAAAMIAATAALIAARGDRSDPCAAAAAPVDAIWSDATGASLTAAFETTGEPNAARVAALVRERLDAYAGELRTARIAACRATERREQSPDMLDRRIACLDRRGGALDALVNELSAPSADLMARAVDAAASLPLLEPCDDREQLLANHPLPTDPAARARLDALEATVDQLSTDLRLGRYKAIVARAAEADAQAAGVTYPAARARLEEVVAEAYGELGDLAEAEKRFRAARTFASEARDIRKTAEILTSMTYIVGSQLGRADGGRELGEMAALAIEQLGGDPRIESSLALNFAAIDFMQGKHEPALAHLERAIALRDGDPNASPKKRAKPHALAGFILANLGRTDEARAHQANALSIYESELGPDHPKLASVLVTLALTAIKSRAYDEAERHIARVIEITDRHSPGSFERALAEVYSGMVKAGRGDHRAAIARFRRAEAITEAYVGGRDHPYIAMALEPRGRSHLALGELDDALEALGRARAIRERHLGADNPETARVTAVLARAIAASDPRRGAEATRLARAQRPALAAAGVAERDELEALDRWLAGR